MKTANERMNNLMATIATAHSNILNITKTIYRQDLRNYDIQRSVLSLVPVLLTKLQQVVRLERTLDTFLLGVHALLQRKLSPILIDHDTLTRALQTVHDTLKTNHPDFEIVHKQTRYYYHSANVLYAGQPEQILVMIEIPIASTNTKFNLYHILTFPVPFNDSSLHGTRVTNLLSQDSYCQYPPVCRLLTSGMINHFSYCFVCRLYCLLPIRRKYLSGIWNKPFEIYKDLSVFHRMDVMFDMNVFEVVCTSMFYSVSILPVLVSCWCAVKYSWRK